MVFLFYKAEAASLCFPFGINKCAPAISAGCCMHLLYAKRKQNSKWFPNQFTSSQMQTEWLSLSLELHFRTACPVLFKGKFLQFYPKKPFQITPSDARGDFWLRRATVLPRHRHCFQRLVLGGWCEVRIMASTVAGTAERLSSHLLGFLIGFGTLGRCVTRTDCCLPSESGLQKRVMHEGASKLCFSPGKDACTLGIVCCSPASVLLGGIRHSPFPSREQVQSFPCLANVASQFIFFFLQDKHSYLWPTLYSDVVQPLLCVM